MLYREQCFDAAMEVASEQEEFSVVHAWVHMGNMWTLHAWAETPEAVYDLTESEQPYRREEYYAQLGVTEERLRRYSRLEFFTRVAEERQFGPFDKELFFAPISDVDPLEVIKKRP